jgi:hypothetical protein
MAVGVLRTHGGEGAEDDQVQRALQHLDARLVFTCHVPPFHLGIKWKVSRPQALSQNRQTSRHNVWQYSTRGERVESVRCRS